MKPDFDEIRKRLEALKGQSPWFTRNSMEKQDLDFVAHAPTDIAYLLEQNEKLEAVRTAELWFKEVWQVTQLHFGNQHGELKEMLASLEHAQDAIDLALAALEVQKGKADDQK